MELRHRRIVEDLARRYLPGVEIWAYGSRVNGQSHDGSDLDIVLRGSGLAEIRASQLADFDDGLRDSTLPFLVEARDWVRLPERFHAEIERNHMVLVPAQLPWRDTTIGDCASLIRDNVSPSQCGDLPYIGLEHIGQGTLALLGAGTAKNVESTKTVFRSGDILFGKLRPYFRKVVRPRFDGICSTDIWVIRPRKGVDAGYLFYMLASSPFVGFSSQGAGGTRMPRAKWEHVSGFSFRLPPLADQRAIARVLDALDDKIELNRRMATMLEEAVRALFKSWFVNVESSWPVKKLADVTSTTKGRSYRSEELVGHSDTAMVTLKSFKRGGGYRPDGLKPFKGPYKEEQVVRSGDVVIACTDVTQAADVVGRSAVVQNSLMFNTLVASLDVLILRPKGDLVSSAFLYGLTNTHAFVAHAQSYATGTTVLHMDRRAVPSFEFRCPPMERLAAFDGVAAPAIERIGNSIGQTDCLTELRDALLPKLLSGEIRTKDAEKIAEDAT